MEMMNLPSSDSEDVEIEQSSEFQTSEETSSESRDESQESSDSDNELPKYSIKFNTKEPGQSTSTGIVSTSTNKRGSSLKKITAVVIDSSIFNEKYATKIREIVPKSDVHIESENLPFRKLIVWFHEYGRIYRNVWHPSSERIYTDDVLCILHDKEYVDGITTNNLIEQIKAIQDVYKGKRLTFLVFNLKNYLYLNMRQTRSRRNEVETNPRLINQDMKMTEVKLQFDYNVDFIHVESDKKLADIIYHFSKSAAYADKKINEIKKDDLTLCSSTLNPPKIKINESGAGLLNFWKTQISMLPGSSLFHAEAIVREYPTYQSLIQAYKESPNPEQMLKNIIIDRSHSFSIQIGTELSKKIYKFYNSLEYTVII